MPNPITVTALINAPQDKVWTAFNDPQQVPYWNFASPEWHCTRAESDLRVGGTFGSRMEAKDGSMGFDFGGEYTYIDAPHTLRYRIGDGREVIITLVAQGAQTRITEQFEPESTHPAQAQQQGWQAILDNFKAYVESKNVESDSVETRGAEG